MTTTTSVPFSLSQGSITDSTASTFEQAKQAAEQFESIFLNQMLSSMFESSQSEDVLFGGSYAEDTYRDLLTETYADEISKSGGIGIADSVMRELIGLQEMEQ